MQFVDCCELHKFQPCFCQLQTSRSDMSTDCSLKPGRPPQRAKKSVWPLSQTHSRSVFLNDEKDTSVRNDEKDIFFGNLPVLAMRSLPPGRVAHGCSV
eukprot:583950-Amphidinium_carterae.3